MRNKIFIGAATALYTPFTNGAVNINALKEAIERQIEGKIDALVILGTTGECPTVEESERFEIIKTTVSQVRKRVPVIVGCGSNDTKTYVKRLKTAKDLGADAALAVTPYYNKCSDDGLFKHYEAGDKLGFPTIVYNVPSRTGVNIKPETYEKLIGLDSIRGIKEASCDMNHIKKVFEKVGDKIPVYSGSDELNYEIFSLGASGTISVLSNVIPEKIHDYFCNFKINYKCDNLRYNTLMKRLANLLFSSINPIPLKSLVKKYYKKGYELRLPLCELPEEESEKLYVEFESVLHNLEEKK